MTIYWMTQEVRQFGFVCSTEEVESMPAGGECGGRVHRDENGAPVELAAWSVYSGDHATAILQSLRIAAARSYAVLGCAPKMRETVVFLGTRFQFQVRRFAGGFAYLTPLDNDNALTVARPPWPWESVSEETFLEQYGPLSQWTEPRER